MVTKKKAVATKSPKAGASKRSPASAVKPSKAAAPKAAKSAKASTAKAVTPKAVKSTKAVTAKTVKPVSSKASNSRTTKAPVRQNKLYVLDTSVMLHDPTCLIRFHEHDVMIPFVTLEELDNNKNGSLDKNRNARQAIRQIEQVVEGDGDFKGGFALATIAGPQAGRLFVRQDAAQDLLVAFDTKFDNRFIALLEELHQEMPGRHIVLVSKDINLRIKAKVLGHKAEDYMNDKVVEDSDLLWRGYRHVEEDFIEQHMAKVTMCSWVDGGWAHYRLDQPAQPLLANEFISMPDGTLYMAYDVQQDSVCIRQVKDYQKNAVWGIKGRNEEQAMALAMLLDPNIDFITLLGPAGTGKTLLTLAAALEQTMEKKDFQEVLFTRATVSLGDDIGFLPGSEEEKMMPWLGALEDNIETLTGSNDHGEWGKAATKQLVMSKVKVKSISFMRGRTFHNKFVIIDEAQNLTAKQMKALITRAGDDTKIICMGNLSQIDTPYLSESNSGLAYAADRFKNWAHYGHLILEKGERSRLANHANDVL